MLPQRTARSRMRQAVGLALTLLIGTTAGSGAAAAISTAHEDSRPSLSDAAQTSAVADKLSVYFESRSTELSPDAMAIIADNASRLKSDPTASVTLVGYTDEVGSSSYGVALAQRRASAVADALIGMGVDQRQVRSRVYGGENDGGVPVSYRRVEFRYLKPRTADLQWPATTHDALR